MKLTEERKKVVSRDPDNIGVSVVHEFHWMRKKQTNMSMNLELVVIYS